MPNRYSVTPDVSIDRSQPISEDLFGASYTGFRHLNGFADQASELGATHVRWPGGTLSERRDDIYDISRDVIFDGTQLFTPNPNRVRPDLPEMLAYANQNAVGFTILIPTVRYADDIEAGERDLEEFLARLYGGDFGPLPTELTLEIGNEYYATEEFSGAPELYGQIANRFIEVIERAEADPQINSLGAEARIAVQMGLYHDDDSAIRDAIFDDLLREIDSLVFHHNPISFENLTRTSESDHPADEGEMRFERMEDYFDAWSREVAAVGGDTSALELYMSEWAIGGTATDVDEVLLEFRDYGLQAASTAVHLIANYAELGVDSATVWGIDTLNLNQLSVTVAGETIYRPLGLVFDMMTDTLPGARSLGWSLDYTRSDAFMVYGFETADQIILYVAANDISDSGESITLDFSALDVLGQIDATLLTSELPPDLLHLAGMPEAELYELGLFVELDPIQDGSELTLNFSRDYEVIEIIIEVPDGVSWIIGDSVASRGAELLDGWIEAAQSEQTGQSEIDAILEAARSWTNDDELQTGGELGAMEQSNTMLEPVEHLLTFADYYDLF